MLRAGLICLCCLCVCTADAQRVWPVATYGDAAGGQQPVVFPTFACKELWWSPRCQLGPCEYLVSDMTVAVRALRSGISLVCDACDAQGVRASYSTRRGVLEMASANAIPLEGWEPVIHSLRLVVPVSPSHEDFYVTLTLGKAVFMDSTLYHWVSHSTGTTWEDAAASCARLDLWKWPGYLASLNSGKFADTSLVAPDSARRTAWVGGTDVAREGEWLWVTGGEGCGNAAPCDIVPLPIASEPCMGTQCGQGQLVAVASGATPGLVGDIDFNPAQQPDTRSTSDFLAITIEPSTGIREYEHHPWTNAHDYICEFVGVGDGCLELVDIAHVVRLVRASSSPTPAPAPVPAVTDLPVTPSPLSPSPPGFMDGCDPNPCGSEPGVTCSTFAADGAAGAWSFYCEDTTCGIRAAEAALPDGACGAPLDECCVDCDCATCEYGECAHAFQYCVDPDTRSTHVGDWYCACEPGGGGTGVPMAIVASCAYDECAVEGGAASVCSAAGQNCVDPSPVALGAASILRVAPLVQSDPSSTTLRPRGGYPCDSDSQCMPGLRCELPVPGQAVIAFDLDGTPPNGVGVCVMPWRFPGVVVVDRGSRVDPPGSLQIGEGSCSADADCTGANTRCWLRSGRGAGNDASSLANPSVVRPFIAPVPEVGAVRASYCYLRAAAALDPDSGPPLRAGEGPCNVRGCETASVCVPLGPAATRPFPGVDTSSFTGSSLCVPSRVLEKMREYTGAVVPGRGSGAGLMDWTCECRAASGTQGIAGVRTPAVCTLDECTADCNSCAGAAGCTTSAGYACDDWDQNPLATGTWTCSCLDTALRTPSLVGSVPDCTALDECNATCTTCRSAGACPQTVYACDDPNATVDSLGDWVCGCPPPSIGEAVTAPGVRDADPNATMGAATPAVPPVCYSPTAVPSMQPTAAPSTRVPPGPLLGTATPAVGGGGGDDVSTGAPGSTTDGGTDGSGVGPDTREPPPPTTIPDAGDRDIPHSASPTGTPVGGRARSPSTDIVADAPEETAPYEDDGVMLIILAGIGGFVVVTALILTTLMLFSSRPAATAADVDATAAAAYPHLRDMEDFVRSFQVVDSSASSELQTTHTSGSPSATGEMATASEGVNPLVDVFPKASPSGGKAAS